MTTNSDLNRTIQQVQDLIKSLELQKQQFASNADMAAQLDARINKLTTTMAKLSQTASTRQISMFSKAGATSESATQQEVINLEKRSLSTERDLYEQRLSNLRQYREKSAAELHQIVNDRMQAMAILSELSKRPTAAAPALLPAPTTTTPLLGVGQQQQPMYLPAGTNQLLLPAPVTDVLQNRRAGNVIYGSVGSPLGVNVTENLQNTGVDQAEEALRSFAKARADEQRKLIEELEKEAINKFKASASQLYGGEETLNMVSAKAATYGFEPKHLKDVYKDAGSGVTTFKYQLQDANGVMDKLNITVDKSGNIATGVARRFQSFGEAIARDTIEFMKWSLSIALVLGPLQEISKLAQETVKAQDSLVNTTIALSNSQKSLNQIYTNAYEISKNVSEEVGNVADAFTLAYRATGGTVEEANRFSTATKLLTDSLTLSKLAGIDESKAIDTLTASLRQENMTLDNGSTLLDMWVQATKIANVNLQSLAESFAMAGDLSESAGMSAEDLTGLIAALGETSTATASELATMTKSVISGFQSDKAVAVLEKYGIALTDVSGKARTFTDMMNQLAAMRSTNLLTDQQFKEITLALGGGSRRQSIWSTLISNWSRVGDVSAGVSGMNSQGSAAAALALKQETVVSATTRMTNALSNLAMTLGTKGGLLDAFTSLINLLTGLIDGFDKVSASLGKAAPLIIATSAALLLGKTKRGASTISTINTTGENILNAILGESLYGTAGGPSISGTAAEVVGRRRQSPLPATGKLPYFLTAGIIAGTAYGNATDQSLLPSQRGAKTTADIIGGVGGAIVGTLTGAGPLIGSTIGMSISEAFVNATLAREVDWEEMFKQPTVTPTGKEPTTEGKTDEQIRDELNQSLHAAFGKQLYSTLGEIFPAYSKTVEANVNTPALNKIFEIFGSASSAVLSSLIQKTSAIPASNLSKMFGGQVGVSANQLELTTIKQTNPELYKQMVEFQTKINPRAGETLNENLVAIQQATYTKYKGSMDALATKLQAELLDKLVSGEITSAAYRTAKANTEVFNVTAAGAFGTFGEAYQTKYTKDAQTALEDFSDVLTYSSEEQITQLSILIQQIADEQAALAGLEKGTTAYDAKQQELNSTVNSAAELMNTYNLALAKQIQMLDTLDLTNVSNQFTAQIEKMGEELQRQAFFARVPNATENMYQEYVQSLKPIVPKWSEGYGGQVSGIASEYLSEAGSKLIESGLIPEVSKTGISLEKLNATAAQLAQALAVYETVRPQLQELGYVSKETPAAVMLEDGQMQVMNKDWKLVQFLLGEILDTEQKQLETNLYNFPSGMTAYVPWGAVNTTLQQGGGGGASLDQLILALQGLVDSEKAKTAAEVKGGMGGIPAGADLSGLQEAPSAAAATTVTKLTDDELERRKKTITDITSGTNRRYSGFVDLGAAGTSRRYGGFVDLSSGTEGPQAYSQPTTSTGVQQVQTRLNIDVKATTQVMLNGAEIGRIVGAALASQLLKMGNAGSTTVRVNVI